MESLVEAEHSNGSHGRLGAVRTFPVPGTGIVRHKALLRLTTQGLNSISIGQIAVANRGHRRREKRVPIEDDIATPGDTPDPADGRDNPAAFRLVDRVPSQNGLDRIHHVRSLPVFRNGLLIGFARALDDRLNPIDAEGCA